MYVSDYRGLKREILIILNHKYFYEYTITN